MKVQISLLMAFCFCMLTLNVQAKKWRVNNLLDAPAQVDFNQLTDAVDAANAGDTIYVEGSALTYQGGVAIFKKLTIIGPGYLKDQDNVQPSAGNRMPAVIGNGGITIGEGSDGTYITGLTIYLNPNATAVFIGNTSDITFTRNRSGAIFFVNGTSSEVNLSENIKITRNLLCDGISFGNNTIANQVLISNNLIRGDGIRINPNSSLSILNASTISYNTIASNLIISVTGCNIFNNYVGGINPEFNNISVCDNILSNNTSDNQAIVASCSSNVIDSYDASSFICDNDNWVLPFPDQSDNHGAYSFDSCCPYYSNNPISPANLPAIPVIYETDIESCGDTSIQVVLKVRSNN